MVDEGGIAASKGEVVCSICGVAKSSWSNGGDAQARGGITEFYVDKNKE